MEQVLAHSVNHIDVAPSYGEAELRLGPWLARERDRFFVGCKTMERTREGATNEMRNSLKRLQIGHFDLYQIHAITTMEELDAVTKSGGALDAVIAAREAGLTQFIGMTAHGSCAPALLLEALKRFPFDTVLFPLNFVQFSQPTYRGTAEELLRECAAQDVGIMTIKAIAKGPWGEKQKTHATWYEPFENKDDIQVAVNFVLSQRVTGLCTAGDIHLLPLILQACEEYTEVTDTEQDAMVARGQEFIPLFEQVGIHMQQERRAGMDRRSRTERRKAQASTHMSPERRSGKDRRSGMDRRALSRLVSPTSEK
jgi:predicted aldo/keto reductase-like oxidoreductase